MKKLRNNIFIVLFTLIISVINLTINVIADPIEKIPIPNHTIITAKDGIIKVLEIQGENAKKMNIQDFLRGNKIEEGSKFE